jgi:hypothetical protein
MTIIIKLIYCIKVIIITIIIMMAMVVIMMMKNDVAERMYYTG